MRNPQGRISKAYMDHLHSKWGDRLFILSLWMIIAHRWMVLHHLFTSMSLFHVTFPAFKFIFILVNIFLGLISPY